MHEFSLVKSIFDKCLSVAHRNQAGKIVEIRLELGDFTLVVEDLIQRSFEIISKGSIAEDAIVIMKRKPGVIQCNKCGEKSDIWFADLQKIDEPEEISAINQYEAAISEANLFANTPSFRQNMFKCKKCGSRETDLIAGQSIVIKNIMIK